MDKPNTITMTLEIPIPVLPQITELMGYITKLVTTNEPITTSEEKGHVNTSKRIEEDTAMLTGMENRPETTSGIEPGTTGDSKPGTTGDYRPETTGEHKPETTSGYKPPVINSSQLKNQYTSVSNKVEQELEVQWPASVEEVAAYCASRKSCISPEKFYDYYEKRRWRNGGGELVKNWKKLVEKWEAREYKGREKRSAMDESYDMMREWAGE